MSRVPRFKVGDRISAGRLGAWADAIDRANGLATPGKADAVSYELALFQLGPSWSLGDMTGTGTGTGSGTVDMQEPYRLLKCENSRLVYYFQNTGVYKIKDGLIDRPYTVWHVCPVPHDERVELTSITDDVDAWPQRYRQGDWAWCIYNFLSSRWEILDISYGPLIFTIAPAGGIPHRNGRRATGVLCDMYMEVPVSASEFDLYPIYNDGMLGTGTGTGSDDRWRRYVFHMDPVDDVDEGKLIGVVESRSGRLIVLWESCNEEETEWYNE